MPKLNPLDHPICYQYPHRIAPSAWLTHVPFGMFLVDLLRPGVIVELGTYSGVSYCAFCQAVKELGLKTHAYAIDSWQGDPHSGFFGPEVLQNLKKHHDPLYGDFSRLIQTTFDEALEQFETNMIDLLHIDGYHTYKAVKHNFRTWLPKMSEQGVVFFHDINVREREFGVWKLWDELRPKYPSFELVHGHGLGLIAVGKDYPKSLNSLIELSETEITNARSFFYQLGHKIEIAAQATEMEGAVQALTVQVDERDGQVRALTEQAAEREQQVQALMVQEAERDGQVQAMTEQVAEREQQVQALMVQVAERDGQVQAMTEQGAEREQQVQALNSQLYGIKTSRAWRAAMLLRRTRGFLLPHGGWRAGLARRMLSFFFLFSRDTRILHQPQERKTARVSRTKQPDTYNLGHALLASGIMNKGYYGAEEFEAISATVPHADVTAIQSIVASIDKQDTSRLLAETHWKQDREGSPNEPGGGPSQEAVRLAIPEVENYLASMKLRRSAQYSGEASFSIVTPFFNHYDYFRLCAESVHKLIRRAHPLPIEWIVINDDPRYTRKQILDCVPSELVNYTNLLVDGARKGVTARLNEGILAAKYHWILFLDCDDLMAEKAVDVLVFYQRQFPSARYISSCMVDIDENGQILRYRNRTSPPYRLLAEGMIAGHLKAICRDVFDDYGLYNEGFNGAQDYEFALRVAFKEPLLFVPEYLYSYRWHSQSQSVAASRKQTLIGNTVNRYYLSKYLDIKNRPVYGHASRINKTGGSDSSAGQDLLPERGLVIIRTQGKRDDFLLNALESVAAQGVPVEALVVVHAERTAVERIRQVVSTVRVDAEVLHAPVKTGHLRGYPINVALRHIYSRDQTYGFVFFLDDDDIVYPMFGPKMFEALKMSGADVIYAKNNRRTPWQAAEEGHMLLPPACLVWGNFIPSNSYVIRYSTLQMHKPFFDEGLEYLEDWEFLVKLLGLRFQFTGIEDTLSEFRITADGNTATKRHPSLWEECDRRVRSRIKQVGSRLGPDYLLSQLVDLRLPLVKSAEHERILQGTLAFIEELKRPTRTSRPR